MSTITELVTHLIKLKDYEIVVGDGLLSKVAEIAIQKAPAHKYAIISDSTVAELYGKKVLSQFDHLGDSKAELFTFPAGESHKTRDTWASLTDQLLNKGYGRDSAIIALGGGVVGDMAGFVAATYMRGISFVQVPTTLLAMIDASIGGKTGVDTTAGKNLVGAFHQPCAVIVDPDTLKSLPSVEIQSGLAEAVKHGAIADENYFDSLVQVGIQVNNTRTASSSHQSGSDSKELNPFDLIDADTISRIIARSIEIKAEVVEQDEREGGIRKILNFGHTVGHAVELLSNFTLPHGYAISIGMCLESAVAEQLGLAAAGTTQRISDLLTQLGLPTIRPAGPTPSEIVSLMVGDKKSRAGKIEYSVPSKIGSMANPEGGYAVRLADNTMLKALEITHLTP